MPESEEPAYVPNCKVEIQFKMVNEAYGMDKFTVWTSQHVLQVTQGAECQNPKGITDMIFKTICSTCPAASHINVASILIL